MREGLVGLAQAVGLSETWTDANGEPRAVPPDVLRRVLTAMGLACDTPAQLAESRKAIEERHRTAGAEFVTADLGKPMRLTAGSLQPGPAHLVLEDGKAHDLELRPGARGGVLLPAIDVPGYHRLETAKAKTTVAVAPLRAYGIRDVVPDRKSWGIGVQIYSLWGNDAVGDFGALARFAEACARWGADTLAISPVHALFAADPSRYSPYAPSSRDFLNVLYASPEAALGDRFVAAVLGSTPSPKKGEDPLIDWAEVSGRRLAAFARLYDAFRVGAPESVQADFQCYCGTRGSALQRHAVFEALHGHFRSRGVQGDWQAWPAEFQNPDSDSVSGFTAAHRREVEFHQFLQWLAERSLAEAQSRARAAGMQLGLVADLAIGLHSGGSHAWSRRHELLVDLSVGAPPDQLNRQGQNWGLTAISPEALAFEKFAPFLATLRASLRHAGGIRVDHILGLNRLWLIPEGAAPTEGAYLHYPFRDLMRLLILESHRHRAIVIGEDLGTVPRGFQCQLSEVGVMGMDVLWFARRKNGAFIPPRQWSPDRVGLTTTHDLPSVAGWWRGRDIDWAERCGTLGGSEQVAQARAARRSDRRRLWAACRRQGTAGGPQPSTENPAPVVDAVVGLVAESANDLVIIQAEDIFGLEEQPNVPGTVDRHPNWRRRLPEDGEVLLARPDSAARLDLLRRKRGAA